MTWSTLRSACLAMSAILLLGSPAANAYELWSQDQNEVGNCAACHGAFRSGEYTSDAEGISWGDTLHNVHLNNTDVESSPNGTCDSCHGGVNTSNRQVNLRSSAVAKDGTNAISCMGCHGRLEDANTVTFFGPGWGAGLRQHHFTSSDAGAQSACGGCHADANPANFTTASEDTLPAWYASVTRAGSGATMDPCNASGEEDFSGDGTGLDNDGDQDYDAANDADCGTATPFIGLVSVADINGGGAAEIGVLQNDAISGDNIVDVRDGLTDALLTSVNFGTDVAVAMKAIEDINGNGFQEIVVLGTTAAGHARAHIRDSSTGVGVNALFYGTAFAAVDMAIVPDTNGNNVSEIAVLGQKTGGGLRVQARDALTGSITSTTYFSSTIDPAGLLVLPDISGNSEPEFIVFGFLTGGEVQAQMRDSATGAVIRNIRFGSLYVPSDLALVSDLSGDGAPDLALAGRRDDTGAARVEIKSTSDGSTISKAYLGTQDSPVQVLDIGDANTSGSSDIAVLVERAGGGGKVVVRDGATGAQIRNTFFSKVNQALEIVDVADLNASGNPELAVLGDSTDSPGTSRVQVKDSIDGTPINEIDYP